MTYQIGVEPVRIDILTHVSGIAFGDAWKKRVPGTLFGVSVHFISLGDLISNEKAAGRTSDSEHLLREMKRKDSAN